MKTSRKLFLTGGALAAFLLSGCAGDYYGPGPYVGPSEGPYFGGFGPYYGGGLAIVGGGHHFYGRHFGGFHGGGFHGGGGGHR